jgi:hypothetical protein
VLQGGEQLAAGRIDDVLEAVPAAVAFLGDESPCRQTAVHAREIGDGDLHVMAVVGRQLAAGLAEHQAPS